MRAARLALVSLAAALCACAGDYTARTFDVRQAYEQGDYPRALKALEPEAKDAEKSDRNRLLVLMDKGMLLHAAGNYRESIKVLSAAEKLADQMDVVSISEEAKVLLSNEREKAYRGEDYERVMLNVLLALDYALLGEREEALVEVRRVNERLTKMIRDEKKPYQQLAIARYLGGVLYEDAGELDNALIDYEKALETAVEPLAVAMPLARVAKRAGRDDVLERLAKSYPNLDVSAAPPGTGEVVVIVEAGQSPEKVSLDRDYRAQLVTVPVYRPRGRTSIARVTTADQRQEFGRKVTSLDSVAQVSLNDRIGRMLAKNLAGTLAKAAVAGGVGAATKHKELGLLTFYLLTLANQPDLRSWLSLPAEFQIARLRLPAGKQTIEIDSEGTKTRHEVDVAPGKIALVAVRRY